MIATRLEIWWRLRAAVAEFPDRNPELPRLVGHVLLNPGACENEDADRQHVEHQTATLERCGLGAFGPVRLKGNLRQLAVISPADGDVPQRRWAIRRAAALCRDAWHGADPACPRSGGDR
jgi:hypothetical protein